MPRSTRTTLTLAADAITIEGALIPPAMLARVATQQANGQSEEDYRVPKGLTLRDEIARYFRIGQALFTDFHASPLPSAGKTVVFVEALLRDVFGFADLVRVSTPILDGQLFAPTLEGLLGRAPIVVVPPNDELDHPSEHLTSDHRRRSAASALQDWLNANEKALWGICCNGDRLRLVRDNASLTRPSYIEADLRHIFDNETFADFTTLWLLVHSSRFGVPGAVSSDSYLEHWREAGQREGVTARDRLRDGVEAALLALGTGFLAHEKNGALRDRLRTGTMPLPDFFGQLLRLVYRLIFLLTAEDRELLHMPGASVQARKLYADGYSLGLLRDRAVLRAAWDRHHDRWEGLLITFSALARGEPRLGLPALDGLFATGSISDLEAAHLSNRALMEGVYRLAWLRENSGLFQVNWRDMETEELGSVYESLLELTPRLTDDGHAFGFAEGSETKGHARKITGSYYTPDALVQALLNSAFDPVLDHAEAEANDPAQALLGVTVIDPACGSGHFLLAAARRIATRLAKARTGGVASAGDFRHALRDVVRSCIHGIDRNPMAVELTKVALWIETVEPGKPLGFLDSNIRCGDSLLGIYDLNMLGKGIPDAAYRPLTGDDKETAKHLEKQNEAEREGQGNLDFKAGGGQLPPISPLVAEVRALRSLPEDSPQEIATKRARFQASRSAPRQRGLRVAADLYVAAFLTPKKSGILEQGDGSRILTTGHLWKSAAAQMPEGPLIDRAHKLAEAVHAFHWALEFPDIMDSGGFDVVLGNPPWERIKLQEQEFFASRDPEISEAPNAATRERMIGALKVATPGTRQHALYEEFEMTKRIAEASSVFARIPVEDGGRFPLTGRGDVNTYALFAELAANLVSPRGRAGIIVPTGIATDETTAGFFGSLLGNQQLFSLYDFQTGMGFFDRIGHARFKFCLLTFGRARSAQSSPEFSFFSRTIADFNDRRRFFTLTMDEIKRISPNTTTVPIFRTAKDAELTAKIYTKIPVLIEEEKGEQGNLWNLRLRTMFHKSNASEAGDLRPATELEHLPIEDRQEWVSVHEGEYGHQFDHRFATFDGRATRQVSVLEHQNPTFEPEFDLRARLSAYQKVLARWRVPENQPSLLAFRRVSNSTNDRTCIAAILPLMPLTYGWIVLLNPSPREQALLCANINSLVFDYCLRNSLNQPSIPQGVFQQTPVLPPSLCSQAEISFVVPRVLELTFTSYSIKPFAESLGYHGEPFGWNDDRRALLRAELDAWYARGYGITRDDLRYILDPADVMGSGYPSETFRVLKKNEIARFGEYRTARLVLAAWDRMERGEIRDVSPAIAIAETASAQTSIDVSTLPDGAWANPTPSANASLAQIAALIKALPGPTPIAHVRLAAIFVLEPRYLSRRMPQKERGMWSRLVGHAADLVTDPKVINLTPSIPAGWRNAVTQLLGMRAIIEDSAAHTWAAGPGLDQFVVDDVAWPYGRATFVLQALSKINLDEAVADLPDDEQAWVRASAA
jgi:hypothetical protein